MKLTEHSRSFYTFSIQILAGTTSLSLNTNAVQDHYPVLPEAVVFRREPVVLPVLHLKQNPFQQINNKFRSLPCLQESEPI